MEIKFREYYQTYRLLFSDYLYIENVDSKNALSKSFNNLSVEKLD